MTSFAILELINIYFDSSKAISNGKMVETVKMKQIFAKFEMLCLRWFGKSDIQLPWERISQGTSNSTIPAIIISYTILRTQ